MSSPSPFPWRTGRKVHRTVYDANDVLIGVMDHPADAALVVEVVNKFHLLRDDGEPLTEDELRWARAQVTDEEDDDEKVPF